MEKNKIGIEEKEMAHDAEYLEKMQEDRVEEALKQMDDEIPEVSL